TNRDFRLANNSPYRGLASDGADPGVNWATLSSHLGFDPRDNVPVPTPSPTPTPIPTPTPSPTPTATPTPTPSPTPTASPTPSPSPTPTPDANGDTIWVEDVMPAGAIPAGMSEGWNWVNSGPNPFSGSVAHQSSIVSGVHHHMFSAATNRLTFNTGEVLI